MTSTAATGTTMLVKSRLAPLTPGESVGFVDVSEVVWIYFCLFFLIIILELLKTNVTFTHIITPLVQVRQANSNTVGQNLPAVTVRVKLIGNLWSRKIKITSHYFFLMLEFIFGQHKNRTCPSFLY